jgi:superfamily II DNA or RNA helicase
VFCLCRSPPAWTHVLGASAADRTSDHDGAIPLRDGHAELRGSLDWQSDEDRALDGQATWVPDPDQLDAHALPFEPQLAVRPRAYQREAVRAWLDSGGRGVVVLPTGAGKTVVALMALEQVPARALVIVPTIELLGQWRTALVERAGIPPEQVGVVGGGHRSRGPITVMTYDSAAMPGRDLAGFGLLIVDEVHHLPAPAYRAIARRTSAPWRLGLTATPERADGAHLELATLIGLVVYRRMPAELASEGHIATYREQRVFVELAPEERMRYDVLMAEYRWYLASRRLVLGPNVFEQLVMRTARDPAARRALRSHRQARLLALNAEAKITRVEELLERHKAEQVLVFSEYVTMVDAVSRQLGLPAISYRTPPDERRAILERFRSGRFTKLVAGRVLNEGVDVPDASVAIVVSGSASIREYVQRLGRVLRPKPGQAVLYEIISRGTTESRAARARRPRPARGGHQPWAWR